MEPGGRLKRSQLSVELEFPAGKSVPQQSEKLAAEESAQNSDRQEELPAAGDPAGSVWRESSCRHDAVNMRVVQQVLTPTVHHGQEADLCAEMLRIGCDLQ